MEALREANDELSALLLGAEAPTGEALSAAIDRVTVLRTQLLADAAEAALDLRAILTADQLATAATLPEPHDRHMPLP
jgi:hypothetical protein